MKDTGGAAIIILWLGPLEQDWQMLQLKLTSPCCGWSIATALLKELDRGANNILIPAYGHHPATTNRRHKYPLLGTLGDCRILKWQLGFCHSFWKK